MVTFVPIIIVDVNMNSNFQLVVLLVVMTTLVMLTYILLGTSLQDRVTRRYYQRSVNINFSIHDCQLRLKKSVKKLRDQAKRHRKVVKLYEEEMIAMQRAIAQVSSLAIKIEAIPHCSSIKHTNFRDVSNHSGLPLDHQYDSIPEEESILWENFTPRHVYSVGSGVYEATAKPFQSYTVNRKLEHLQLLSVAGSDLQVEHRRSNVSVSLRNLADGYSLFERTAGITYVLHYLTNKRNIYRQMEFVKPFADICQVKPVDTINKSHQWINIIITLQGRLERFKAFMQMFVDVCVKRDDRIFLTVVYFGQKGIDEARQILKNATKDIQFRNYIFYTLDIEFSRGRGLTHGAKMSKMGNILLFFCDVDIVFDQGFLDRCRWYTSPGKKVYYPIVWSFYNPDFVYANKTEHKQFSRTSHTGTWRKFGFGMTCQYRDDFFDVKGFDDRIQGWGREDVDLYKKFLYSKFQVLRGVDRGIYHVYHSKHCDPKLTVVQYRNCCNSRIRYEASKLNLGQMVLAARGDRDIT